MLCTTTVYHGALVNHSLVLYALTPRALPRCTAVHYHTSTTGLVSAALPARQAGWPGTPDFAEWRGGKIQISRNGLGGTQNTEITGVGEGLIEERNLPFISTVC